jgi:RNA polymerase sigma-70 factor (ECF subfamily)
MREKEEGMDSLDPAGRVASSSPFVTRLAAARGGDAQALGELLQSFHPYLLSVARHGLPSDLRGKCDDADLVQETLLEAHRGFARFDGTAPQELRVWLRGILKHNLMDLMRRYRASAKRSIRRERSLEDGLGAGEFPAGGIDPDPTPCTLSITREDIAALRAALVRLPAGERAVICLRSFESLSFQEIGHRLDRTPEAARKFWSRAMLRLHRLLETGRGTGSRPGTGLRSD